MNQALADNIRALREERAWTQEQLAEAAQVHHRTIQRAEAAQGASAETLLAIAGALNVDVELLRFDGMEFLARQFGVPREQLTPEFISQKNKELIEPYYTTLPLTRVTASADLRVVSDAMALFFECATNRDDVQDAAALLQSELNDLIVVGVDIDPTFRRKCETEMFGRVRQLEKLGAVVTTGLRRHRISLANQEPVPWTTLFVIVAPEHEAKQFIMIPKQHSVRFT